MSTFIFGIILLVLVHCESQTDDVVHLSLMIKHRAQFMQTKNLEGIADQFSEDISWINSQGYLFDGKKDVMLFHKGLVHKSGQAYIYKAGKPRVTITDDNNAIIHYGWQMLWHKKDSLTDTIKNELGVMTLICKKINRDWKFQSIIVQHTPYFYESIDPIDMSNVVIQ